MVGYKFHRSYVQFTFSKPVEIKTFKVKIVHDENFGRPRVLGAGLVSRVLKVLFAGVGLSTTASQPPRKLSTPQALDVVEVLMSIWDIDNTNFNYWQLAR